jgi:DNA-binding transcriptional regulator YiaG
VGSGVRSTDFKGARLKLGLTQQKMADLCGIHLQTWVKWERGEQKPPAIARQHVKTLLWLLSENLLEHYIINYKGG